MLKTLTAASFTALALVVASAAIAQEDAVDRVTVELTDPSKPAFLSVGLVNGSITVTGYDGKEVIVEAITSLHQINKGKERNGKNAGMTRLQITTSSLTVEEYQNKVEIGTESWVNPVDLVV